MKIGFALITAPPFFNRLIELENRCHNLCGFYDRLGKTKNLPHTTLFQGNLRETCPYEDIAEEIAASLRKQQLYRVTFSRVVYVPEGWCFLECVNTPELAALHRKTLALAEPYIVLPHDTGSENMSVMSACQQHAIRHYGYRYAGEAFYPHITLGRTTGEEERVTELLNRETAQLGKEAMIDRVTVYGMGNNGTHAETLYKIKV